MAVIFENASYIIDENFIVRSFNDAAKKVFPGIEAGSFCYKSIRGYESPCPDCPLVTNQTSNTVILSDDAKKRNTTSLFPTRNLTTGATVIS